MKLFLVIICYDYSIYAFVITSTLSFYYSGSNRIILKQQNEVLKMLSKVARIKIFDFCKFTFLFFFLNQKYY